MDKEEIQKWFDTIEKELEALKKQYDMYSNLAKDIGQRNYNLATSIGISKSLAIVHKINIDYIMSK